MTLLTCCLLALQAAAHGLPLSGETAEEFLRSARVVSMRELPIGITGPRQATLDDGRLTLKAVWKTVDVFRHGATALSDGRMEVDFRDSYRYEIAAYELDKVLGLGLVPPTVERRIDGERGAMQLWVEGALTELDRIEQELHSPNPESWRAQVYKMRLLHQLTWNSDRRNVRNILLDPVDFKLYVIDHSRAFRLRESLMDPGDLRHFSRAALNRLRLLDDDLLRERLEPWLSPRERSALLARSRQILILAELLVAEKGAEAVLYP